MRAIVVAVILLAVFSAGYHHEQKHPQTADGQKAGEQAPPKAIPPVASPASAEKKPSTYEKAKEYLWKASGPEFLAAWVLVIAAGIGLCATFRTLKVIKKQTTATEEDAKAALLNAKAIINTERPWLVVTWGSKPDWPGSFLFGCKNRGNTPAKIVSMSAKHLFIDKPENLPLPPDYSSAITMPDLPFKIGGDELDIGNGLNARSIIISSQKEESVRNTREFLVYYGNVVYKDTFFPDSPTEGFHETRWCFVYQAAGNSLKRSGPEEYNRYT